MIPGWNAGGWGLTFSTRDMIKIGELEFNNGILERAADCSKSWLEYFSAEKHSHWGARRSWMISGYLWWDCWSPSKPIIAAMGDGGNINSHDHEQKLVVAITAFSKKTFAIESILSSKKFYCLSKNSSLAVACFYWLINNSLLIVFALRLSPVYWPRNWRFWPARLIEVFDEVPTKITSRDVQFFVIRFISITAEKTWYRHGAPCTI